MIARNQMYTARSCGTEMNQNAWERHYCTRGRRLSRHSFTGSTNGESDVRFGEESSDDADVDNGEPRQFKNRIENGVFHVSKLQPAPSLQTLQGKQLELKSKRAAYLVEARRNEIKSLTSIHEDRRKRGLVREEWVKGPCKDSLAKTSPACKCRHCKARTLDHFDTLESCRESLREADEKDIMSSDTSSSASSRASTWRYDPQNSSSRQNMWRAVKSKLLDEINFKRNTLVLIKATFLAADHASHGRKGTAFLTDQWNNTASPAALRKMLRTLSLDHSFGTDDESSCQTSDLASQQHGRKESSERCRGSMVRLAMPGAWQYPDAGEDSSFHRRRRSQTIIRKLEPFLQYLRSQEDGKL
jgi:hypothetical protein